MRGSSGITNIDSHNKTTALQEKLLMFMEVMAIPEHENEVRNELYDMGIQDVVLDMFGWFSGHFMDFVILSKLLGERNEKTRI